MPRATLLLVPVAIVLLAASTFAGEKLTVKDALSSPILDPNLPLAEVQDYTEARVPPMPDVKTVAEWEPHADRMREETLKRVVFRGEAEKWRAAETKVEWLETIEGGPGYRIKKLRYEALPGLWIPALLYEPDNLTGKVPVALNVNGHDRAGKAAKYKQIRCVNLAKRGMLALNVEWVNMGQLAKPGYEHYKMNQLDLCGTSGLAPFYLSMSRALDLLLAHENADSKRVAVAGLSGGGWQTIFISALDTRVTLSNPVAGYSSFRTRARHLSDLGDSEQTPVDLATTADYSQLTAMRAPRPTLLTYNAQDNCCFKADHALPPLMEAAGPIFKLYGKEANLRSHVNHDPGNHNFELDNRQQLYRMIGDHFFADQADFDPKENPSDDEVKTAEQLLVELPADNADFNTLALALANDLPRQPNLPEDKTAAVEWQKRQRQALTAIVRSHKYDVQAVQTGEKAFEEGKATLRRLRISGAWTVPAVELVRGEPKSTVILLADGGRAGAAETAQKLLESGRRVVAIDPFYLGESKIAQRDFLFALLVSAVGDRPLGVQASQLAAIARWLDSERKTGPVEIVTVGPRTSLMALIAAGLEEKAIAGLELHGAYGSLKEIIEQNQPVTAAPELFCAGLLEQFDVRQLAALSAPRPVRLVNASGRAQQELKGLAAWYGLFGTEFDPLPPN